MHQYTSTENNTTIICFTLYIKPADNAYTVIIIIFLDEEGIVLVISPEVLSILRTIRLAEEMAEDRPNTPGDRPHHAANDRQAILYHQGTEEDSNIALKGQNESTKNITDVIEDHHFINKTDRPAVVIDHQATTGDRQDIKVTDRTVEVEDEDSSDTPKVKKKTERTVNFLNKNLKN